MKKQAFRPAVTGWTGRYDKPAEIWFLSVSVFFYQKIHEIFVRHSVLIVWTTFLEIHTLKIKFRISVDKESENRGVDMAVVCAA